MVVSLHSVGVDLGGTWIRLEALDAHRRRCRFLKAPAPDLKSLPRFLQKTFQRWKQRPQRLTVGSRGVWKTSRRRQLQRALRSLADQVQVMSDVETAWHAAFGRKGTGIIVLAGTGSIAFGQTAQGKKCRAGGLGPARGDEGSAFWMGKTSLSKPPRRISHATVRRVAALATGVLRKARAGNAPAKIILEQAQEHLAALVLKIAQGLGLRGTIPVSWGGSILDDRHFRAGFVSVLKRHGCSFKLQAPKKTAAWAAAEL